MLTQSAPAIVNAFAGQLPDAAVKSLLQAVGNCSQPLTHRAPISFQPPALRQSGPGTYGGGTWNPASYTNILPSASQAGAALNNYFAGAHGASPGGNSSGNTFAFPASQEFALNNFYGGPNVYNAGNSYFENAFATNNVVQNQYVTNLSVQYINGEAVPGAAGPPGVDGESGFDGLNGLNGLNGLDGFNGVDGLGGADGQRGINGFNGAGGAAGVDGIRGEAGIDGLNGLNGRNGLDGVNGRNAQLPPPKNAVYVRSIRARRRALPKKVVTNVAFDPATCSLHVTKELLVYLPDVRANQAPLRYYGP